jgi:excisionase family DNA binding protein
MKQVLVQAKISASDDLLRFSSNAGAQGEWLTVEQAAEALNCCSRTIRNLCKAGKLRYRRVGKLYRVHVSELSLPAQPRRTDAEPAASASPRAGKSEPSRPAKSVSEPRTREEEIAYDVLRRMRRNKRTGDWELGSK